MDETQILLILIFLIMFIFALYYFLKKYTKLNITNNYKTDNNFYDKKSRLDCLIISIKNSWTKYNAIDEQTKDFISEKLIKTYYTSINTRKDFFHALNEIEVTIRIIFFNPLLANAVYKDMLIYGVEKKYISDYIAQSLYTNFSTMMLNEFREYPR